MPYTPNSEPFLYTKYRRIDPGHQNQYAIKASPQNSKGKHTVASPMIMTIDQNITHPTYEQNVSKMAKLRTLNLSRQDSSHPKTNPTAPPQTIKPQAEEL
jgi:hypothetical protein